MDDLAEQELFEATAGLGNWHEVEKKPQYLANREECLNCLRDLLIALEKDDEETGHSVRLKLGEWKVLSNHLVPLFTSYREDQDISTEVLKLMVVLTTRVGLFAAQQHELLHHLQDYKDAFAKKDVFIILMGLLVETMEEDEENARPNRQDIFKAVLTLLRNLVSVPDPCTGDAGFTPLRRNMQSTYIRHFHDEGVLDFFSLFAEGIAADREGEEDQAWLLGDILYHICTHVDPEDLMRNKKEKNTRDLADLLEREVADSKLRAPQSSRHSRFGTSMHKISGDGKISVSASVLQTASVNKGGTLWRKEFRNPTGSDKKHNMFHNPFFVDLEEGSVRDHNLLNPHVRNSLESAKHHPDAVIAGLKKFFEEFVQTSFSALASILRSSCSTVKPDAMSVGTAFNKPHLLNFVSWFLEFHRHLYGAEVSKAKKNSQSPPVIDIGSIQGAIDLDMIQFTTARLRQYGKESNIHASFLVIVLRSLCQQIKTISVVTESADSETRDCGDLLVQNIVKDDVMAHLSWIMKNWNSRSHDPRILSYTIEAFHTMIRLMTRVSERQQGRQVEFQVEKNTKGRLTRSSTTTEKEIAGLADARVVEALFHLLEKYRRHSPQLHSMLVKLIYQIVRAQPTNIVIFFELSYFMRIFRLMSDPMLSGKTGKKYAEMISLLQYILRQFFKCAETNGCVFAELLFRKVLESQKESLLESHTSEFAAILDNYEDESYKRVLERMGAGETLNAMREKQRAILKGQLPWTEEEDDVLKEKYSRYADHPLFADLLASELPDDSQRTALQVRKRLVELGLMAPRGTKRVEEKDEDMPSKKAKQGHDDVELEADGGAAADADAAREAEMLEEDLQRLLDAAFDSQLPPGEAKADAMELEEELEALLEEDGGRAEQAEPSSSSSAAPKSAPASQPQASQDAADLEKDLEAMLEEDDGKGVGSSSSHASVPRSQPQASQANLSQSADSLERDLENLLDEPTESKASQADASCPPGEKLSQTADSLEMDLERLMDEPSGGSAPSQPSGQQAAASEMQASQANPSQTADSLEMDLERLMDEEPSQAVRGASQVPMSQSGKDSLSQDLERLMDEASQA